jgi:NADPH2:quinone reductase
MSLAIIVRELGGPEVLKPEQREVGDPGPGEIRVRNYAIGVNFIDAYERKGLYKQQAPFVAGNEGAGEVTAVGEDVSDFAVGDRVAYMGPIGAYAQERLMPAERAVMLPATIDYDTAAAVTLKGATAYYLIHLTHTLKAGETILLHASAGATGLLIAQWAKAIGAHVIGTAGSEEKIALAREHGCEHAINYRTDDFVARVKEITGGRGVDVVYDGVGKATFEPSLDCLRPRGLMVSFGNASGVVSIPDLTILARKGSLYVTRPTTGSYFRRPEDFRQAMAAVYAAVHSQAVKPLIGQTFPLKDAAEAHRALEGRETVGSTLLVP